MGNFLQIFNAGGRLPTDINVDWSATGGAEGSNDEEEKTLYTKSSAFLERSAPFIEALANYKDCSPAIREAMSKPRDSGKQLACFEALLPNVRLIKGFHQASQELEEIISGIVKHLVRPGSNANQHPLLVVQMGRILTFCLEFDQKKMMCPAVQNDFSFFRRSLGKHSNHPSVPVSDVEANSISMFVAQALPMMSCLKNSLASLQGSTPQTIGLLAEVANLCCATVLRQRVNMADDVVYMVMTTMTMAIVLYDECAPTGVFRKGSHVEIKRCIQQIKTLPAEKKNPLLNVLQYSTKNYKKAPESIRRLIVS